MILNNWIKVEIKKKIEKLKNLEIKKEIKQNFEKIIKMSKLLVRLTKKQEKTQVNKSKQQQKYVTTVTTET